MNQILKRIVKHLHHTKIHHYLQHQYIIIDLFLEVDASLLTILPLTSVLEVVVSSSTRGWKSTNSADVILKIKHV